MRVVRQWQLQRRLSTIRSCARRCRGGSGILFDVGRTHVEMFGYVSALRAALAKLIDPKYGRERSHATHGVDTRPWTLADSQIPPETMGEAIHYEPAHTGVLHHLFRSLPFRHEDYHLVDLGFGKGRTLLVGPQYPFKAITASSSRPGPRKSHETISSEVRVAPRPRPSKSTARTPSTSPCRRGTCW